jgi:hypothetical protein
MDLVKARRPRRDGTSGLSCEEINRVRHRRRHRRVDRPPHESARP